MLDVLVQSRRAGIAVMRLMLQLQTREDHLARNLITDKLRQYPAAKREIMPGFKHRSHKGLNNSAASFHPRVRRRERVVTQVSRPLATVRFDRRPVPMAPPPRRERKSADFRELRFAALERGASSLNFRPLEVRK